VDQTDAEVQGQIDKLRHSGSRIAVIYHKGWLSDEASAGADVVIPRSTTDPEYASIAAHITPTKGSDWSKAARELETLARAHDARVLYETLIRHLLPAHIGVQAFYGTEADEDGPDPNGDALRLPLEANGCDYFADLLDFLREADWRQDACADPSFVGLIHLLMDVCRGDYAYVEDVSSAVKSVYARADLKPKVLPDELRSRLSWLAALLANTVDYKGDRGRRDSILRDHCRTSCIHKNRPCTLRRESDEAPREHSKLPGDDRYDTLKQQLQSRCFTAADAKVVVDGVIELAEAMRVCLQRKGTNEDQ